jgi:hypothetical protein
VNSPISLLESWIHISLLTRLHHSLPVNYSIAVKRQNSLMNHYVPHPFERSDVTEIIYPISGYFKKHKDYLSLTSNSIQEYTLIVRLPSSTQQEQAIETDNLSSSVVGGETLSHSNGEMFTSSATAKPGGALLFRKDLEHEGAVLKSSNKRIVTVILWAIDQPSSSDIKLVLISFPPLLQSRSETTSSPPLTPKSKMQKLSAGTELRSLSKSDESQTYALKVSTILAGPHTNSFFGGFVCFSENSNHYRDDDNGSTTTATMTLPIIRYVCKVGTYEQFKGVYNLLTSCRSKPEEIDAASDLFAYFNFDTRCILVDLASSANDDENGNKNLLKQKKTGKSEIQKLLEFEKVGWNYIINTPIGRDLELGSMPVSRWASEEVRNAPPVPIVLTLDSFMWAYCENGLEHVQEVRIQLIQ